MDNVKKILQVHDKKNNVTLFSGQRSALHIT